VSSRITVADKSLSSRYEITVDGELAGFLTYRLSPELITFVHTEIDPEREGEGLGGDLVQYALDDARERGLGVRPVCPFVAAFINRHMEYADLVV